MSRIFLVVDFLHAAKLGIFHLPCFLASMTSTSPVALILQYSLNTPGRLLPPIQAHQYIPPKLLQVPAAPHPSFFFFPFLCHSAWSSSPFRIPGIYYCCYYFFTVPHKLVYSLVPYFTSDLTLSLSLFTIQRSSRLSNTSL